MLLFEVLYCDEDILVVNKAAGLPCHPLRGEKNKADDTLIEAVAKQFPEVMFDESVEGGLCHRLDNDTSGIVIIARNKATHRRLRTLFSEGRVEKTYLAIVEGTMASQFEISWPIAHHAKNKRKMIAMTSDRLKHRAQPKEAHTLGKVLLSSDAASLVRVQIGAGRRHQIRVHMASLRHPLIGDALYGGPKAHFLQGHALHAATLILPNGRRLEAPCPSTWDDELRKLGLTR